MRENTATKKTKEIQRLEIKVIAMVEDRFACRWYVMVMISRVHRRSDMLITRDLYVGKKGKPFTSCVSTKFQMASKSSKPVSVYSCAIS